MSNYPNLPLCTRCGMRVALHRVMKPPTVELICCQCYINDGNPPVDFHEDCVAAFEAKK